MLGAVVKLVYTTDLKSVAARHAGSIPARSTINLINGCVGKLVTPGDCKSSALVHCWFKSNLIHQLMSRSSRGLGHHPFTVTTPVRIWYGTPYRNTLGIVSSNVITLPAVLVCFYMADYLAFV